MVNDEIWEVFEPSLPLLGATYGRAKVRMVALGLRDGGLVVVSPGSRCDAARAALEKWGTPRFLLAPNHFHNAGLAEWKRAYPDAEVVASPVAHARLKKQVASLTHIGDLSALSAALPTGARVFGPPMAKQGEAWLAVDRGDLHALAVCDALANLEKVEWMFRLVGFRAKLMTNPLFKRFFLKSKAEYKRWLLAELDAHPPNLFIPAHGTVLKGAGVADQLRRATDSA
jgi:hypothetical protein